MCANYGGTLTLALFASPCRGGNPENVKGDQRKYYENEKIIKTLYNLRIHV